MKGLISCSLKRSILVFKCLVLSVLYNLCEYKNMEKAIAYYRVSTSRQGKSGLGIEAQKEAVRVYTTANEYDVINEHTEVESGRKDNRPELLKALDECKRLKAILIIAKLDRLGRNVAFIANLMESKVQFVAVDTGKKMVQFNSTYTIK